MPISDSRDNHHFLVFSPPDFNAYSRRDITLEKVMVEYLLHAGLVSSKNTFLGLLLVKFPEIAAH